MPEAEELSQNAADAIDRPVISAILVSRRALLAGTAIALVAGLRSGAPARAASAESDLVALANYLKTVRAFRDSGDTRPAHAFGTPGSEEAEIRGRYVSTELNPLRSGAELYSGYCASCHQQDGAGSANQAYPSLFHNTATGAGHPANLVAAILYGVERNTGGHEVLMPAFGRQSYVGTLTDQQVADIGNFVLARFGNPAAKVTAADVATARAGGPVPLLARLQPYMLPLMALAAAILAIIVAAATGFLLRRYRGALTH